MKTFFPNKQNSLPVVIIALLIVLNLGLAFLFLNLPVVLAQLTPSKQEIYPELTAVPMQEMDLKELQDFFTKVADIKGAEYAFELLKRSELPQRIDTHLVAHKVGDMLYKQRGATGIQYCTHDFRNACSHSIVIGLYLEKGEKALSELAPLCKKAPGGKGAYGMCFHGLGHGVLALSDYDMRQATGMCDRLSPSAGDKTEARECVGGMMMEMASGIHDPEIWRVQVKKFITDDPLSPCNSDFIPSYAQSICYTYLTPQLFKRAGAVMSAPKDEDFQKAFPYCDGIPATEPANRAACYGGFGKEFVVIARNRDVRNIAAMTPDEMQKVYRWCDLAESEEGKRFCLDQAVGSLYWGGENDRSGALRFCQSAPSEKVQTACFNRLTGLIAYYINDPLYKKAYCAEIPGALQAACKKRLL